MCGDALSLMERMDNDCYHAVVTDPPYASGGLTTAERKASPARKYLSSSRAAASARSRTARACFRLAFSGIISSLPTRCTSQASLFRSCAT